MAAKRKVTSNEIKIALSKRHKNDFFLTECKTGPTQLGPGVLIMDSVAIAKSWTRPCIKSYEIKVSRSDFQRDNKYSLYLPYCHEFYFVCPAGLIERAELEPEIGLVWYNPDKESLFTKRKAIHRNIEVSGDMLMYIIMNRLESDRHPFYNSTADYWRAWLEHKINNRALGKEVKSKLLEENIQLEKKLERLNLSIGEDYETAWTQVQETLRKHGTDTFLMRPENLSRKVEEALNRGYPEILDDVAAQMETALKTINQIRCKPGGE